MPAIHKASIEAKLAEILEPTLQRDLVSLRAIDSIEIAGSKITIKVVLGYPANSVTVQLAQAINRALEQLPGVEQVSVDISWQIATHEAANSQQAIAEVKNIIAVASGKGGVGKSTTAVNLALALAAEGARVGILDADIYGPSQPQMLGVGQRRPEIIDSQGRQQMMPILAHGVQSISMGYLVTEETPMMWRGPMVTGALQQLLLQTHWRNIDYLIIDMPPGTGDIQITLAQKVPVTGALIVTTPQDIALLDAKKAIEMFRKVKVPVLGVVENMAVHICSHCGHEEHVFGTGGGARIARDYGTELIGALPLDLSIREHLDLGRPSVAADPTSAISQKYRAIARKLAANLWWANQHTPAIPDIEIIDD